MSTNVLALGSIPGVALSSGSAADRGFTEADVAAARRMHEVDLEVSRTGARFDEFAAGLERQPVGLVVLIGLWGRAPSSAGSSYRRWYRSVMDFDPVPVWRSLDVPALFLFGDPALDRSSPVARSMALAEGLRLSGKDVEVVSFAGAATRAGVGPGCGDRGATDGLARPAPLKW